MCVRTVGHAVSFWCRCDGVPARTRLNDLLRLVTVWTHHGHQTHTIICYDAAVKCTTTAKERDALLAARTCTGRIGAGCSGEDVCARTGGEWVSCTYPCLALVPSRTSPPWRGTAGAAQRPSMRLPEQRGRLGVDDAALGRGKQFRTGYLVANSSPRSP